MIRSFVAIALPDVVSDALEDLQEGLAGAHWTAPDNLHLTLAFLGEQPRRTLEDLDAALVALRCASFRLRLSGVDAFGKKDARVIFAGVAASPPLLSLQAKVASAARDAEIALDARRYAPHVTIARLSRGAVPPERLHAYLSAHNLFETEPFDVREITLFRSTLTRDGPIYEPLATYPLAAA